MQCHSHYEYEETIHRNEYGMLSLVIIIRPHRCGPTTYVDAVCCYQPSSVVCRSVCLSVCHTSEPC